MLMAFVFLSFIVNNNNDNSIFAVYVLYCVV